MTVRAVLATVAENVALPLLAYAVLAAAGLDTVAALLGSAAASALVVGVRWVRDRRVPMLGALVGVQFLVGIAVAGLTGDARLMLAKEALGSAVSATVAAGSLPVGTPMRARIHRGFAPDPQEFDRSWAGDRAFRIDHVRVTAVWACGLAVAAGTVVLASYLPLPTAVVASHVVSVPVYLVLIAWTVRRWAPPGRGTPGGARSRRVDDVDPRATLS